MSTSVLILAYHAIEAGPPPLCIEPTRFEQHLDILCQEQVKVLTVAELANALREGPIAERAVVITFDDGAASVADAAAPLLAERGLRATAFCVAGHLGRFNDWPTEPKWSPRLRLATAEQLRAIVRQGVEIGSHGMYHTPLAGADKETAHRELVRSKQVLEAAVGVPVTSFAPPGNASPSPAARAVLEATYDACCIGSNRRVRDGADPLSLYRVDAHYLRRPWLLQFALHDVGEAYIAARRIGARIRRLVLRDFVDPDQAVLPSEMASRDGASSQRSSGRTSGGNGR
jgi:peptidoglycan/xylan/chitin deacetylase (PgdA/CDA1 family)